MMSVWLKTLSSIQIHLVPDVHLGWIAAVVFASCMVALRKAGSRTDRYVIAAVVFIACIIIQARGISLSRLYLDQPSKSSLAEFAANSVAFFALNLLWIAAFPYESMFGFRLQAHRRLELSALLFTAILIIWFISHSAIVILKGFSVDRGVAVLSDMQSFFLKATYVVLGFLAFRLSVAKFVTRGLKKGAPDCG